jgi:hypothetical protein
MKQGLIADVYKDSTSGDCTLGGVSASHQRLVILGKGVAEIFHPTEFTPAVLLVERVLFGEIYLHTVPCDEDGNKLDGCWAMGGNFIYSSDSRFPSKQPIAIHDRNLTLEK